MPGTGQAALEKEMWSQEQAYLEATPHGNIITGYDHYMRSGGGAAARRKMGLAEHNRVFTNSSVSYRPNGVGDPRRLASSS
jgi:hypothetical protein